MKSVTTSDIAVERAAGGYPLDEVRSRFKKYGLAVLREFLPASAQDDILSLLEKRLSEAASRSAILKNPAYPDADFLLGDVLAIRELEKYDYIFLHEELQQVLRALLGVQETVYFGDSSVQFGEGARGFHKDNVDRYDGTQEDWRGEYTLIRCGFYCQDHTEHSGGLKVRISSHDIPAHRKGQMLDVATRFGDLVLWNMRLTHSGNNKLARLFPGVMHPRLEAVWPDALTLPEERRRIAAFCAFGAPGAKLDRYIDILNHREDDYKPYIQRARNAEQAQSLLARYGVSFRKLNDYYGELD
jgi:hypothetical protein